MKFPVIKIATRSLEELNKELRYLFSTRRSKKILFDHIPKCGGSSLNRYLEEHYPRRKIFNTNGAASIDRFINYPQSKRYEYDLIKGHLANKLIDYAHPECLKITILREPIDRLISHYFFAKRSPEHYLYSKIHESGISLEDYVTLGISTELRNWYTTHFSGLNIADAERDPQQSVNLAIEVLLSRYDIIGFLDEFSSFTDQLQNQAQLRLNYQNKKINVTQGRISVSAVQESTINKFKKINHLDIAMYQKLEKLIN